MDVRITLECIVGKQGGMLWSGFIWLSTGLVSDQLLWTRWWTFFGLHKRRGTSWPVEWLSASQGLCSVEL